MKSFILTESEKNRIRNLYEESDISKEHPVNNPFYRQMLSDIDGDNVIIEKKLPNGLIIDAFGNKYTITKTK
jgi:hypothetical protein